MAIVETNPTSVSKSASLEVNSSTVPQQMHLSSTPVQPNSYTGCASGFVCGQQNKEFQNHFDDIERRLKVAEENTASKNRMIKHVDSAVQLCRIMLFLFPITCFIALMIVQYFVYKDSTLLNIITAIVGVATVAECIFLPTKAKQQEDKIDSLEEKIAKLEEQMKFYR